MKLNRLMISHPSIWISLILLVASSVRAGDGSFAELVNQIQPKMVKIYGAGGLRGLEAYQSGIMIAADGHILTAWSYVLDTEGIRATLHDGRSFQAELIGVDPWLEIAILKIDADGLPHFNLGRAVHGRVGERVLAFSNLFGVATGSEPVSVQRGVISAVTRLTARRGVFQTAYEGPVFVLDAMTNNPGAAGGGLTNIDGDLLGLLGNELKNRQNNTWLNYALPVEAIRESAEAMIAGRPQVPPEKNRIPVRQPVNLEGLGIGMVPDVVDATPPFVDAVASGSPAAEAGFAPDDLVLFVGDVLVPSIGALQRTCERIESGGTLRVLVRRGEDLKKLELHTEIPAAVPGTTGANTP
ncbi:MAG: serine protease [Planctomycetaceae bacterium]|nr:serine protease [Planctomycetaceae bacterium]